ncbi:MAG: nuclear transport factor 2 family protein [Bacteroidales bacterium]|nr:nuclear transport factor 2 family protein [Bacteroidales bacterium]
MNKFKLIPFLCILMIAGCKQETAPVCDISTEKEAIKLLLQKYIIANEARNISMIGEVWANDTAVYSLGTDRHDIFRGFESVQKKFTEQFERFENTFISSRDQVIYVHPECNTGWFSEILQYNYTQGYKAMEYSDLRFTGFLEKRNGKWVILQTHLSAPADR